ncbi:hypothetical protein RCF34_14225 [Pseudomonas sp. 102515]|uniref:hypothetical protein n=1 Tax=Pseudomonas sp. 102515 TaxID=3071568 RepID=UPI0028028BB6|nr:hypothetical protein [Pseudomonas sp. 102515]MDQ7914265.1 hypothetical protein [Pseudomonas sp. 102515]
MQMLRLVFGWFVLLLISSLLLFKTYLHSDLLFLDSVMVDIFQNNGSWRDWKITPAPAYFPDVLSYAIGYWLLPNPALRVVFVCVIQAITLAMACLRLARVLQPDLSVNTRLVVLGSLALLTFVASHSGMWLFFNSTNNHFAALLFPILALSLILGIVERDRGFDYLLLAICVVAGTVSTSIFILSFTLPMVIMSFTSMLISRRSKAKVKVWAKILAALCLGHLLSTGVSRLLISYDALSGRAPMTVEGALVAAKYLYAATLGVFGRDNLYTFTLALVIVVAMAWLSIDCARRLSLSNKQTSDGASALVFQFPREQWQLFLCFAFLCLVIPVSVVGVVASGGFLDLAGYRYFAFPLVLAILLSIVKLSFCDAFERKTAQLAIQSSLGLIAVLGVLSFKPLLVSSGQPDYATLVKKGVKGPSDYVASCIDGIARQGLNLGSGVADFWNARSVSYKSSFSPYILPVLQNADPFFHMMTLGPLKDRGRYDLKPYNFAILNRSGTRSQFDLLPETIGRSLPKPEQVFTCAGTDLEIWFYSDQSLNDFMQAKIDSFLGQTGQFRRYEVEGDKVLGLIGGAEQHERTAVAGRSGEGFLMYGPYIDLPPGEYQVTIDYSASASGSRWDAGRFNDPEKNLTISSGNFLTTVNSTAKRFTLKNKIEQFEIRAWYNGQGNLSVRKVSILRVSEQ